MSEVILTVIEQESRERSLSATFGVKTVQGGLQQRLFPLFTSDIEKLDFTALTELARSHDDERREVSRRGKVRRNLGRQRIGGKSVLQES